MNKYKIKIFSSILLLALMVSAILYPRYADALAVTVKRVVFEGPKRAEVITIINNSDVEETYRLGWKNFVMTQKKALVAVPADQVTPEMRPAMDMVRFSPRRFTLAPKESQQVRMMLRMPGDLADGEYRSHLWIRPEEDVEAFRERSKRATGNKAGVYMQMLAGTSMPIIVRKGPLEVSANIENLSVQNQQTTLLTNFSITREGTKSSYGDLDFICNKGAGDSEYLLKFIRGVSVYVEANQRDFTMKILKKTDKPNCNQMTIRYTETNGFAGEAVKIYSEMSSAVQ